MATSTTVFETTRLMIRRYEQQDAQFVLDMYSRWDVQRFLGRAPKLMQTIEEASAAIERWRLLGDANPLLGLWAITTRGGETVGTVMLKMAPLSSEQTPLPLSEDHEVGWHLHPRAWGHGYATEAAAGALERARDAGVHEVVALIHPENQPSKKVAERLDMEYKGLTNRYYSTEAELYVTRAT